MKTATIRRSNQLLGISTSWSIIQSPEKVDFQSHEIRPPDPEPVGQLIVRAKNANFRLLIPFAISSM